MRTEKNLSPTEEAIKAAYVAGLQSIRQIAKDHEVSEAWVRKLAKKHGWERAKPASAQSGARGRALVMAPIPRSAGDAPSDAIQEPPKSNIEILAEVDPEELAKEGLIVLKMLLEEIKAYAVHFDWFQAVIDEETDGDKSPRRYDALQKMMSYAQRSLATKNIMLAMQTASAVGPGKRQQAKDRASAFGTGRFAPRPVPGFVSESMQ